MRALLLVGIAALLPSLPGAVLASAAQSGFTETEVGRLLPQSRSGGWLLSSPEAGHFSQCLETDGTASVYLDGALLGSYEEAAWPAFGPDGARFAYAAKRGGAWFAVVDGRETEPVRSVSHVRFCPSSGQVTWVAALERGQSLMVEGAPVGAWESLSGEPVGVSISPPEAALAFVGRRDGARLLVLWNGALQELPLPGGPAACWVGPSGTVVQSAPGSPGAPASASFGANGSFAVREVAGDRFRIVRDGEPGPWHAWVYTYDELLGPSLLSLCQDLGVPVFSPDGRSLAYQARDLDERGGPSYRVVLDGVAGLPCDLVGPPVFSPDGGHLAYVAVVGGIHAVLVDGRAGLEHDCIVGPSLCWSPDGARVAYVAAVGVGESRVWHVVAGGDEGPGYPSPRWSPIVGGPCFLADGVLQYLVVRDGTVYRVRRTGAQQGMRETGGTTLADTTRAAPAARPVEPAAGIATLALVGGALAVWSFIDPLPLSTLTTLQPFLTVAALPLAADAVAFRCWLRLPWLTALAIAVSTLLVSVLTGVVVAVVVFLAVTRLHAYALQVPALLFPPIAAIAVRPSVVRHLAGRSGVERRTASRVAFGSCAVGLLLAILAAIQLQLRRWGPL